MLSNSSRQRYSELTRSSAPPFQLAPAATVSHSALHPAIDALSGVRPTVRGSELHCLAFEDDLRCRLVRLREAVAAVLAGPRLQLGGRLFPACCAGLPLPRHRCRLLEVTRSSRGGRRLLSASHPHLLGVVARSEGGESLAGVGRWERGRVVGNAERER